MTRRDGKPFVPPPRPRRGRPPVLADAVVVSGHVPRETMDRLRARCDDERLSISEAVRQAIAAWLGA